MTSNVAAILAIVCIMLSVFMFFKNTYNVLLNTIIRKFWYEAEKCYINCELMFLDEKFTMERCRVMVLCCMFAVAGLCFYFTRMAPGAIPIVALCIGGIVGWILPAMITKQFHRRYVQKFDGQLLDALGMMASGLRSGLSMQQAMGLVASEMPAPMSLEYKLVLSEYNYGKNLDEVHERLADRVPSVDLGIVVESILVLRSTGGNLVETFDIIVDTIRERKKVEGKIKTMTTLGVIQGTMLGSMPFVLMKLLGFVNPGYMEPLFTTTIGWVMVGVVVVLVAVGGLAIKAVITIDV